MAAGDRFLIADAAESLTARVMGLDARFKRSDPGLLVKDRTLSQFARFGTSVRLRVSFPAAHQNKGVANVGSAGHDCPLIRP